MEKDVESVKIDYPLEKGVIVGVCIKTEKLDDDTTTLRTFAASNMDDADEVPLDPIGIAVLKMFMKTIAEAGSRVDEIFSLIKALNEDDSEDSTEKDDSESQR